MSGRHLLRAAVAAAAAVVSLAALVGCGTAAADNPVAGAKPPAAGDLQAALLTLEEHPDGTQVMATMPLREAVARSMPGTGEPSGVVVMPRCISYFAAIGGLDVLEGWYQFGMRASGAIFVNIVTKAPTVDTLDMIRLRVQGCGTGLQSFTGWPPSAVGGAETVTSTLAFVEREVPAIEGAAVLGLTQTTTFTDPGHPLSQTIQSAWGCTDGPCAAYDSMVGQDDLFVWVHEGGDADLADSSAAALFTRAAGS